MFNRIEGELEAREQALGLRMADLLTMPEALSNMLNWLIRRKHASLSEIIATVGGDERTARTMLDEVIAKGYVRAFEKRGILVYAVRMAPKRVRERMASIWDALDDLVDNEQVGGQ